ncbi:unnamed protein product, partial [Hymenolepis diminuta]
DIKTNFDLIYYLCCGLCLLSFVLALFLRDDNGMLRTITRCCSNACNSCRVEPDSKTKEVEDGGNSDGSSSYYEVSLQSC